MPIYKVPSKSKPGMLREVKKINGEWHCDCPAYVECRHIKGVKWFLAGGDDNIQKIADAFGGEIVEDSSTPDSSTLGNN